MCVLKKRIFFDKITFVFQENFGEDPQKPLASLQAGIGGADGSGILEELLKISKAIWFIQFLKYLYRKWFWEFLKVETDSSG